MARGSMPSILKAWIRRASSSATLLFLRPYSCCEKADALVIVTEWDAFRALDLDRVKSALASPVMVDSATFTIRRKCPAWFCL